jgi:triacylglycerol esterase/lipase EstA (alpha/beta hydrolase family)
MWVADGSSSPPGANDWHCAPRAAHPRPVVLVHGTWANQNTWDVLAPRLKAEGYCVFSLNYGRDLTSVMGRRPGFYGTGDIRISADQLAAFIDTVRGATRSAQVDVVAHSQGGVVARQYLRFGGGADPADPVQNTVRRLVTIGATNHGTTAEGWGYAIRLASAGNPVNDLITRMLGIAYVEQVVGSEFLRRLNAAGDTEPGIDYTVIASRMDQVTTPPESTFLRPGPGAAVDNVWVQSACAADTSGHSEPPESPAVVDIVEHALDPSFTGSACG